MEADLSPTGGSPPSLNFDPFLPYPRLGSLFDLAEFLERLYLPRDLESLIVRCMAKHQQERSYKMRRVYLMAHTSNLCRKYRVERELFDICYFACNGEMLLPSLRLVSNMADELAHNCTICRPFRPRDIEDSGLVGTDLLYTLCYNLNISRRSTFAMEKTLVAMINDPSFSAMAPRTKVRGIICKHLEDSGQWTARQACLQLELQFSTYSRWKRSLKTATTSLFNPNLDFAEHEVRNGRTCPRSVDCHSGTEART